MRIELTLEILAFGIISLAIIFRFIMKGMVSLKYALVWIFSLLIILISTIIPQLMQTFANLLGFELLSNMLIALFIGVLMIVSVSLTLIVSSLKEKVRMLTQEVSLIKKDIDL